MPKNVQIIERFLNAELSLLLYFLKLLWQSRMPLPYHVSVGSTVSIDAEQWMTFIIINQALGST